MSFGYLSLTKWPVLNYKYCQDCKDQKNELKSLKPKVLYLKRGKSIPKKIHLTYNYGVHSKNNEHF